MVEQRTSSLLSIHERIARVVEECVGPLGCSQRGIASWEWDLLEQWSGRYPLILSVREVLVLKEIERQVFGQEE